MDIFLSKIKIHGTFSATTAVVKNLSLHHQDGNNMKEILLSTVTGALCGVVFALFKLPVPAPPVFAGVAGIIGLWIGYSVVAR